jgi:hypothetical protein
MGGRPATIQSTGTVKLRAFHCYEVRLRTQDEIIPNNIPILVNTMLGFDTPRKLPPNIEMTGPLIPRELSYAHPTNPPAPSPIPQAVRDWLDGKSFGPRSVSTQQLVSYEGVVYICLGNLPLLNDREILAISHAFSGPLHAGFTHEASGKPMERMCVGVVFRVLWMVPADQRANIPANLAKTYRVKTLGGLPHTQLIADERIK